MLVHYFVGENVNDAIVKGNKFAQPHGIVWVTSHKSALRLLWHNASLLDLLRLAYGRVVDIREQSGSIGRSASDLR